MNTKYIHSRTCIYNINYHIVWCVKYRKKILTQEIASRLYELLDSIAKDKGFTIVECKIVDGSYFVETIGSTSEENILHYIERQKNCQL